MFRIMLATDGSPRALKAARYTADLCAALREPAVTILFVKELSVSMFAVPGVGTPDEMVFPSGPLDWTKVQDSLEAAAQKALADTNKAFEGVDAPITLMKEIGKPADVICATAEKEGFDLIVIGSRGLGEIRGLVLGSVSNHVVHRAKVPVLVVH